MDRVVVESVEALTKLLDRADVENLEIAVWDEGARCVELLVERRPPLRALAISEECPQGQGAILARELLAALPDLEHLKLSGCPLRIDWSNARHLSLRSLELASAHALPSMNLAALPALERLVVSANFPEPMDDGLNDTLKVEFDVVASHLKFSGSLHNRAHCAVERALLSRTAKAWFEVTGDPDVVHFFKAQITEALGR